MSLKVDAVPDPEEITVAIQPTNDSGSEVPERPSLGNQEKQNLKEENSKEGQPKQNASPNSTPHKPYSVYTLKEKWTIVILASVAGIFSPLTANIYLPALPVVAAAFHKSIELINLTVTVYILMQGISPMIWGTLADRVGRRPIFLACLLVLSLSCVGLARVPTSEYWLLMLLRCIQAAGSASTIALGAGIIGDISTPAERGGFFGMYAIGPMVGPAVGPVIGGGLANGLGWRAIFWFLCIGAAVCFVFIALLLPETLRTLVGDGSYPPPSFLHRPIIPVLIRSKRDGSSTERAPHRSVGNPLRILTYPDVLMILVFNGVLYGMFVAITTTLSTVLQTAYPFLNETDVGLCFLTIGGGMLIGTVFIGKLLDREYESVRKSMIRKTQEDPEKKLGAMDITKDVNFPIELARLRLVPIFSFVYIACTIGYGWCLESRVSIAVPLVLLIIIGISIMSVMNSSQTILIDLVPGKSSSVTACNNLVRCSLGAGSVAIIDLIINALGVGWTFVLLSGICALFCPIIWMNIRYGPGIRARRRRKAEVETAARVPQ